MIPYDLTTTLIWRLRLLSANLFTLLAIAVNFITGTLIVVLPTT
jgi:hypothetical protein